jgi:hypothetical protein
MAIRRWAVAILLVLPVGLSTAGAGAGDRPAATRSHVFLIVLENHEYDQVVGNPEAPYLNRLARRGTLATNYYAVAHPSLPNYLVLLGGSTFGITSNCTECSARGSSLALQLSRAGISWRAYMGGMPRPCFRGVEAGSYVKRHNPFLYFPSIASDRRRCRQVVPASRLDADLRRRSLPAFGWLTPDLCNDGHDCGIAATDAYLAHLVPRIMRQLGPRGALIVTFDEGTSDAGCCGSFADHGGGRVMTVIARPGRQQGSRISAAFDHYSLLAGIERHFGLPRLRAARQARAVPLGPWGG